MYTGQFIYCGKKAQLTVGNILPVGELPEGTVICNLEHRVSVFWKYVILLCKRWLADSSFSYFCVLVFPGFKFWGMFFPCMCCTFLAFFVRFFCFFSLDECEAHSTCVQTGNGGTIARASGDYCTIMTQDPDVGKTRIKLPSGARKTVASSCRAMVGIVAGGGRIDKPMLKAGNSYYKYKAKRNEWPVMRGVALNPVEHPFGGGNHQHIGKVSTCLPLCFTLVVIVFCIFRGESRVLESSGRVSDFEYHFRSPRPCHEQSPTVARSVSLPPAGQVVCAEARPPRPSRRRSRRSPTKLSVWVWVSGLYAVSLHLQKKTQNQKRMTGVLVVLVFLRQGFMVFYHARGREYNPLGGLSLTSAN